VKDVLRTICEQCPGTLHLKACSTLEEQPLAVST
jgi:hypothetical protein